PLEWAVHDRQSSPLGDEAFDLSAANGEQFSGNLVNGHLSLEIPSGPIVLKVKRPVLPPLDEILPPIAYVGHGVLSRPPPEATVKLRAWADIEIVEEARRLHDHYITRLNELADLRSDPRLALGVFAAQSCIGLYMQDKDEYTKYLRWTMEPGGNRTVRETYAGRWLYETNQRLNQANT